MLLYRGQSGTNNVLRVNIDRWRVQNELASNGRANKRVFKAPETAKLSPRSIHHPPFCPCKSHQDCDNIYKRLAMQRVGCEFIPRARGTACRSRSRSLVRALEGSEERGPGNNAMRNVLEVAEAVSLSAGLASQGYIVVQNLRAQALPPVETTNPYYDLEQVCSVGYVCSLMGLSGGAVWNGDDKVEKRPGCPGRHGPNVAAAGRVRAVGPGPAAQLGPATHGPPGSARIRRGGPALRLGCPAEPRRGTCLPPRGPKVGLAGPHLG